MSDIGAPTPKTLIDKLRQKDLVPPLSAKIVMDSLVISRQLRTNIINVGTTPTLIIAPPHNWPYLISNPALSVGLTNSVTLFNGTAIALGDTTASPLGVANYLNAHFHIDITAITGTWDINLLTRDPNSSNWAIAQNLFSGLTATGTSYASTGNYGIAADMAIQYDPTAPGSITFSITATLKDGTMGGPTGLARTIFIGDNSVNTDTGYPIFESGEKSVYLGPNVELYAVSYIATTLKVFTL